MSKKTTKAKKGKRYRMCQCEHPRISATFSTSERKWTKERCARCFLPLTRAQKKWAKEHIHCWHPHGSGISRFKRDDSGADESRCCHCGDSSVRKWHTEKVGGHGPHWPVYVKVYEP